MNREVLNKRRISPDRTANMAEAAAKPVAADPPKTPVPAAAAEPIRRPALPYVGGLREFSFPDGRKITIHRHGVYWATPLKDDPEAATMVGIKGGKNPVPLKIPYLEFLGWWQQG